MDPFSWRLEGTLLAPVVGSMTSYMLSSTKPLLVTRSRFSEVEPELKEKVPSKHFSSVTELSICWGRQVTERR